MENPPRFYVPAEVAPGYDGIREALRWLLAWVRDHPGEGVPLIVAPTLNQLRHIDLLETACRAMDCASSRTWRESKWNRRAPLLLLFPDGDELGQMDEMAKGAMCVVPGTAESIEYWVRARNAADVTGHTRATAPGEIVTNPVVRAALRDLGIVVNKNHLVNYEDRAMAVRVLQLLYREGERFTPAEMHAGALADGWSSRAAARLSEIAEGVVAGRTFRLKSSSGPRPDALQRWRDRG